VLPAKSRHATASARLDVRGRFVEAVVALPREGLPGPYGSDAFRAGHGAASPISLCRMWRDRVSEWPSHCRSTPELDQLQVHLSAQMTYRLVADVLDQMLPVDAGKGSETLRRHPLKIGEALRHEAVARPERAASAIVVTLDSTVPRSCEDDGRHLEGRAGDVEGRRYGASMHTTMATPGRLSARPVTGPHQYL
jgi:hypothetical protein